MAYKKTTTKRKAKSYTNLLSKKKNKKGKNKKIYGNALKETAYSLIKKGAAKLVKRRGKSYNTRYVRKVSKGIYTYKLKNRKA